MSCSSVYLIAGDKRSKSKVFAFRRSTCAKNSELPDVRNFLRKILLGITLPSEYITARRADLPKELLCVLLLRDEARQMLFLPLHFLGYKPMLLASEFDEQTRDEIVKEGKARILFIRHETCFAQIDVRVERSLQIGSSHFLLFVGEDGAQLLEEPFHQKMQGYFQSKKHQENIDLLPHEYEQLKAAYSTPREVRLVSVGSEGQFNIFPIDLFGVTDRHLLLSLRHAKASCGQVEQHRKIAVWKTDANAAKAIYALGKNHSRGLDDPEKLPVAAGKSPELGLPQPLHTTAVEEYELEQAIGDFGVHRLLLLRRTGEAARENGNDLVHVHRSYAEWLLKHRIAFRQINR